MSRKPKPKNTLSAGQRAAIYEEEIKRRLSPESQQNISEKAETVDKEEALPEKKKEKPQSVTVKADFALEGLPHTRLNGMCGAPLSKDADISHLYTGARVPLVNLAGEECVLDICRIFKNFDADERREENYSFREADRYVLSAVGAGAKIICPLGVGLAYEYGKNLCLPEYYDKIATVCVNIIKHYNDYWCGGFALDLRMFDILPECEKYITENNIPREDVFELYSRLSSAVKLYDESLSVGGMNFSECGHLMRDFVKFCQKKNSPVDFVSLSLFGSGVEDICGQIERCLKLLKNSSYADAKIMVSKWSYLPLADSRKAHALANSKRAEDAEKRKELFEKRKSVYGASFASSMLLAMQSADEVIGACMYGSVSDGMWCNICDAYGLPEKVYYSLEAYSRYVNAKKSVFCRVEEKEGYAHSGVYAGASSNGDEAYVFISAYDGVQSIDLRLENIPDKFYNADIYMLDGVKNMDSPYTLELSGMKKRMVLNTSPYSVVFIKLY